MRCDEFFGQGMGISCVFVFSAKTGIHSRELNKAPLGVKRFYLG